MYQLANDIEGPFIWGFKKKKKLTYLIKYKYYLFNLSKHHCRWVTKGLPKKKKKGVSKGFLLLT